ncbi:MAG: PorP/SprF family type IX secretion system membrane protein [Bacteroidetes bacterium]|nr:PorP/SprF family type IX secretion system membrane protein [Bacteroidota bacterium]
MSLQGILKITTSVFLIMVLFVPDSICRDPYYTQFSNVPLFYNPAFTGIYTGARVRFCSRSQSPTPASGFNSYYLSADIGDRNLPGSGGFGVIVNQDNEGIGFIKNFNLGASFSARVPLSRLIIGQVGIKASWLQKRVSWDDFVSSQKVSEKYGHVYDSGFVRPDINVLNLPDFGIGGLIQFTNSQGCLSGTVGFAVDHLFEPDESFLETAKSPLARKYTGHADVVFSVRCPSGFNAREDDALKINPGIIFQNQGKANELQAGLNLTNYGIYFGAWYKGTYGPVTDHSVALLGGYRYVFAESMSIKLTYSYDMHVMGPQKKSGGVHEVSLVLEFSSLHLFRNGGGSSFRSLTQAQKYNSQLAYSDF